MLWDPFLYCINDSIQGNSETGNKVFVLPSKVAINNHIQNIYDKLEVSNTVEAYNKAIKLGYIEPLM